MDFTLSDERRMLQDSLSRYLADNLDHERRRKTLASDAPYDADLFKGLADLGTLAALFPEEAGGFGGTGPDLALVFETLGRAGTLEPFLPAALAAPLLTDHADLVEQVIAGESIVTLAHTEPDARYDLADVTLSAKPTLSGTKTNVLYGAQATHLIVSARESGDRLDPDGISLFLVPTDAPGLTITPLTNVDGTASAQVTFTDTPAETRLGDPGQGHALLETATAHAILALSAETLGAMEATKDLTLAYLQERQQFGRPIGTFQALQHRLADMLTEIEQARSAVLNLAGHLDAPRDTRERHVSATKNLVGRVAALVAEEAIQMHGGIGMTQEYELSHHARRLVMADHLFGDVDHHLERFIHLSGG
ncbi:acyl-CoA dehydrogenase family protein [Roseovarius indicus]|uniref:acyl-CoA dehydrogenase family protein n=1 Tax=Roseovarius indicus TaxID=540747 RepID=UPI0032EB48DB